MIRTLQLFLIFALFCVGCKSTVNLYPSGYKIGKTIVLVNNYVPFIVDTNQLWLSITQDASNIVIVVNNANPTHSYYLCATRDLSNPDWKIATPFNGVSTYMFTIPKTFTQTNAPVAYFRTQDITP